jgi:hypothetical protein
MNEQLPSETLNIAGRVIEFTLMFIACVAIKALSPPEHQFYAGWFGGVIFACVYWRVWETIK